MPLTRRSRLVILVVLGVVPPSVALALLNQTVTATTPAAIQAAIAGGIIAAIGTVSSAIYKEVSAYFQQTNSNVNAKVAMISPLVQKYYTPWIHSADKLSAQMKYLAGKDSFAPGDIETLLYYFLVYYGYRMKFVLEAGGVVLLSTAQEQDAVNQAYAEVEKALSWEDSTTHLDISYLQALFLTNGAACDESSDSNSGTKAGTPETPRPVKPTEQAPRPAGGQTAVYLYYSFYEDVQRSRGQTQEDPSLSNMVTSLSGWAKNKEHLNKGAKALDGFSSRFKQSIDQLFTAWGQ